MEQGARKWEAPTHSLTAQGQGPKDRTGNEEEGPTLTFARGSKARRPSNKMAPKHNCEKPSEQQRVC